MNDSFDNAVPTNATEYTVTEISGALKRTVEDIFGNVRVRGEISGYRGPHSSGHAYFALKDDRARLEAVIWRGTMSKIRFRPEEGMEVIATGKLTTYPGSSKYQIVIDNLEPAGAGALMALLEERKRRLQAEGLFDSERKRALPFMPRVIGVVTSPTGAVIRDILHRIADRYPLHVIVWPVRVQGETTGQEVTAAIEGFNSLEPHGPVPRPDVLIVARGGGSLEDLWGFNDEALARAVAASGIPVISAVGHETDWTLIDYVADVRAPTPTGAAEMAVPVKADLEAVLASLGARLSSGLLRLVDRKRTALRATARVLPTSDQLFASPRRHLDEVASRLGRALDVNAQSKRMRLESVRISPLTLLRRVGDTKRSLRTWEARLDSALRTIVRSHQTHLRKAGARNTIEPVARRTLVCRERLLVLIRRKDQAFKSRFDLLSAKLDQCDRLLGNLSHKAVLARGFALVRDSDGRIIKSVGDVSNGQSLAIQLSDGQLDAFAANGGEKSPRQRSKAKPEGGGQGSLF
ncbi:MAG: exodeoxyribonuclease VII large subunit [Rhizobiaceae bacterium]|nr:exodeoxyribonuclease VII large subunit [Rhizobiaceae bacterium]